MFSAVSKFLKFLPGSTVEMGPKIEETIEVVDEPENKIKYFRKTGRVTFLNDSYGLIDDRLSFFYRTPKDELNFSVGDTVSYLSRVTDGEATEKVIRADLFMDLNSLSSFMEEDCLEARRLPRTYLKVAKTMVTNRCTRVVNGKVTRKVGKRLFISTIQSHCDMDRIQCDYIPLEGDQVSVKLQVSENPFEEVQDCQVLKIEPTLVRYGYGKISVAKDNGEGAIDNEIFFTNTVYTGDFKPAKNTPVKFTAIESVQGRYRWRALSIEPKYAESLYEDGKKVTVRFKNGMMVRGTLQFGPMHIENTEEVTIEIRNNGKADRILSHCSFTSAFCSSQLNLVNPKKSVNLLFKPGQSKKFTFSCKARFLGISSEVFEFYFKGFKMEITFSVNVTLTNEVKSLMPEENKKVSHPKKNTYLYKNFDFSDAFFGMKATQRTRYTGPSGANGAGASNSAAQNGGGAHAAHGSGTNKHSSYPLPEDLFKIILGDPELCQTKKHNHIVETVLKYYPSLEDELTFSNYKERFHTLLYFEEIEDRIMYRKFDLHNVTLKKKDNYLSLTLPRLVEDKIVLGIGTQVILTQPWTENNPGKQVGYIHEYRDHEILISFHEAFERTYDESECDIMFQPSRTTYIRSHNAIDNAVTRLEASWLFPVELIESPPALEFNDDGGKDLYDGLAWGDTQSLTVSELDCKIDDEGYVMSAEPEKPPTKDFKIDKIINWFNKDLNVHQKAAIRNVLEGKGRSIPYIIQGPPGTGKTVTVIELVLQLYHMIPDSRIIIATPSNSAADLVCQKLIKAGSFAPGQLIRLLSFGRLMAGNYPEEIGPFCTSTQEDVQKVNLKGSNKKSFISMNEHIGSERIVIGTCCTLSILNDFALEPGHFTHVILDEAAQSTEPESLIPINFIDTKKGQVILTGDTEQLGPISINFLSVRFGFSVSLMERIHNSPPYLKDKQKFPRSDGYDPRCVTKLRYNYRSVPGILRLPNHLFYDSELIPVLSGDLGKTTSIINQFNRNIGLVCESSAVVFHGLRSMNCQEENNFSWYNPHELWQTVCYLTQLYSLQISPDDVGVITPYQKQVEKIRHILKCLQIPLPKIGSVEEFQGQERLVVILSTVRSDLRRSGKPSRENVIGFLSSPRRLNVAITRAKALLIIVGNPYTLGVDRYWLEVIKYCVKNSFYIGCPINQLLGM